MQSVHLSKSHSHAPSSVITHRVLGNSSSLTHLHPISCGRSTALIDIYRRHKSPRITCQLSSRLHLDICFAVLSTLAFSTLLVTLFDSIMAGANCCCCVPLPVAIYVLAPLTFAISLLLSTLTSFYLARYHEMISKVSMALLCLYVIFTILLSLSSILGLAGAIQRKSKWVKIYAELMCMNWFIGVGLGIGHMVKTWRNKSSLVDMCQHSMQKKLQENSDEDVHDRALRSCTKAFTIMNALILTAFILINLIILYFVISAFRAAKHMETEVPAVKDQYNYPPDTWNTHNRNNSNASSNARRSTNKSASDSNNNNRHVQVFQTSSNEEKGHGLYRSQSSSSGFSTVSSSTRKQLPNQPAGDQGTTERARSNTLPMTQQEPQGQTVPLGIGNNVFVSRYTSKTSIDGEHPGWK